MNNQSENNPNLSRQLGLLGLTATGICSMIGASIYIVPIMIQRNVAGIGPYVLPAFLLAALPALLAAFAYASLSSAMPRAGGSYIFASRGLNPYLGFIASFSQWFGLSIVIGVICYVLVPFFRDIALALEFKTLANYLETGWIRFTIALMLLWSFVGIIPSSFPRSIATIFLSAFCTNPDTISPFLSLNSAKVISLSASLNF